MYHFLCLASSHSITCLFFFNDTAPTEIYTYYTLFPYPTLFRSWQPGTPYSLLVMRSNVREANFHSASLLKKDEEGMGVDLMDLSGDLIKIAEKPRRDA